MHATTYGLDLAKRVFQMYWVDGDTGEVVNRRFGRDDLIQYLSRRPPGRVAMEACGSAHHWVRKLQGFGHTVKLMAPQFVKPYVKANKNDVVDAEAICEAVGRPNIRFVPIKSVEQQAVLSLHHVRQGFVTARTAEANQIRGLLADFGLVLPKGITFLSCETSSGG